MDIRCFVVGLHHHNNNLVFDCGMPVSVVFDDENQHSENAFKVLTEGGLMGGYLAESQFYWGSLATRLGAKLSFELKSLINKGYSINDAVVEEIMGRALKYTKVVLKITLNEPTETSEEVSEPMEDSNMNIKVVGEKEGLFTLVGVQYYTDEVEIGSEVELKVMNNTTFGYDQNGELLGTCPQKDSKVAECNELGLRVIRNQDMKEAEELLTTKYTVVGFITKTTDNKVSKFAVLDIAPVTEETTTPEPVVEEETVYEVSVEAETEAEVEENKMKINEILKGDEMLQHKVERRNELINKANDFKRELATIESEIEVLEGEISEIVEKHTLINQIKANLEILNIDELKRINNAIIDNSSSSDEEETTSSSSNNEEVVEEEIEEVVEEEVEEEVEEKTIPQQQMCIHCYECKFSPNSGVKPNVCFYYEHWVDDVLKNKDSHFIEGDDVFKYTYGTGGFDNHKCTVELEDNVLMNVGLWSRGTVPSDMVKNALKKGVRK